MNFSEELVWILDKKGKVLNEEKEYQQNINFVHSLGKKCDCVGWSTLKMDELDADKILDEIQKFCKENGWRARGWYERTYPDVKSDWYELKTSDFKDSTIGDRIVVPAADGGEFSHITIRAYHELTPSPKEWRGICVPERFRNACIKNGINDVDFCWVQDKGKYEAEQYFQMYPSQRIPRVFCDKDLKQNDKAKINLLGGKLPKIAEIFCKLQNISLPDCYLAEDMPKGGIAYVYCRATNTYCGREKVLIHKDTAEMLVNEKAVSWKNLKPVPVLDKTPAGYVVDKTKPKRIPNLEYMAQMLGEYEKLKKKGRPIRVISEKDALAVLRKTKTDRKEDFGKRIGKNQIEKITGTEFEPILLYYKIANGGQLSDEYELLSYEEAISVTGEFFNELEKEELIENIPKGVVFAKGADGDNVLLIQDGTVIRFSHEIPEIIDNWKSMAQFLFDAITETE